MRYRTADNKQISQLGFGAMRLPVLHGNEKLIDEEKAAACLQQAVDRGVNYFDTAWPYHKKASEPFVGQFFKDTGQRDKVNLVTKVPCWECREPGDFDKFLDAQLINLQTDHVDFYLLHALDGWRFEQILKLDVLEFLDKAKASGKVGAMGFSFHDLEKSFYPIVDAYPFDFCQIQLNYMDENYQAGLKGMQYAAAKGMSVMVMEPLRGGQLATTPKGDLADLWDSFKTDLSPAGLGLKYLWDKPEITCVLSGMSTMDQVNQNCDAADAFGPGSLTDKEQEMITKLREFYKSHVKVDCTGCQYCNGCPKKIPMWNIFKYYNEAFMYGDAEASRQKYKTNVKAKKQGDQCIQCGACLKACPQGLNVPEDLAEAHAFLTEA